MRTAINYTNSNSSKNQEIKGKFIGREVYCNVNSLVEYCLQHGFEDSNSPVNFDDLENYYTYPEYFGTYTKFEGGADEQRQEEIERLKELREDTTDLQDYPDEIDADIEALENLESEPAEVYEWWAVSSYLFDRLKDQGEVVIDAGSCYVWGRQTTGQAILLDGVISRICADMEILEGQANEWK